jgi:hypothetical protein
LLAMIGRTWVTAADDAGRRRLDDENDFVRIEIETALQRDVRVVPVPVRGARMPNPSDLPESLRDLAFRQAHPLDHSRWRSDVSQLIDWLKRLEQQSQQPTGLTAGPVVDDPSDTSRKALDRLDSPSRRAKASATRPIRIFVAYDRTDQWIVHALRIHLAPHEKKGLIGAWEERDITVGDDWMKHASNEVEQADIFLLLVSQRFLTSPYPKGMEFQLALKRGHSGAVIVPVLVDENAWHRSPLGKFQALPKGGRPILSWPHPDPALADAARGIVAVADDLRSGGNGYGW